MDVRTLLENTLPGLGYEFVALELINGGGLRLFIDTPEGITLDDCVLVSNHLTRLFAVENVDYDRLEAGVALEAPDWRQAIEKGEPVVLQVAGQKPVTCTYNLSERQREILLAGGLLNHTTKR